MMDAQGILWEVFPANATLGVLRVGTCAFTQAGCAGPASSRRVRVVGSDPMNNQMQRVFLLVPALALTCASPRRFYLHSELPTLGGDSNLMVGPGPWPDVPVVFSDPATIPDDLVLPALKALMALPGAADACDAQGQPRADVLPS